MPGGTAAAAAAVAAGGVWNDGDGDGDALVPFASATMLSPTATPFGDSYADRANAVECSRHIGFAPPTSQRWARSELFVMYRYNIVSPLHFISCDFLLTL